MKTVYWANVTDDGDAHDELNSFVKNWIKAHEVKSTKGRKDFSRCIITIESYDKK